MRNAVPCLLCPILAAALIGAAAPALATAQRTFVASTGGDANPCSLAAPCRSFTAAIGQTLSGGEVIVLDSAGYGPTTITQSISIIAPPGVYAGVGVSSGDGIAVNAPGATVVLRGLSINGLGGLFGVRVEAAARLRIEHCVISNLSGNGIQLASAGTETTIVDTDIRGNIYGVAMLASGPLVVDHARIEQNSAQGLSIAAQPGSPPLQASISDSLFAGNGQDGIAVAPTSNTEAHVHIEGSIITRNGGNGVLATATVSPGLVRVAISHSEISNNQGDGLLASSVSGATTRVVMSDNALESNLGYGIHADGNGARVSASANSVQHAVFGGGMACSGGGQLVTIGNNDVDSYAENPTGCLTKTTGI